MSDIESMVAPISPEWIAIRQDDLELLLKEHAFLENKLAELATESIEVLSGGQPKLLRNWLFRNHKLISPWLTGKTRLLLTGLARAYKRNPV